MKHTIDDLEIDMERGEQIDDGFKYSIIAEFKERQRQQNTLMNGNPLVGGQQLVGQAAQTSTPAAVPGENKPSAKGSSGKVYSNAVCKALAESKGTDWLLALIAFLLFCILISK